MSETVKKTPAKKPAAPKATKAVAEAKPVAEKSVKAAAPAKKAAAPKSKIALVPKPEPTHDEISRRAYEIWAGRGFTQGNPNHDWWLAEQQLKRA